MNFRQSWDDLRFDLRFALRSVQRDPLFYAAAIAIVALGIGANTAMFSVVHGILFRPVDFAHADRLVWIANGVPGNDGGLSSLTTRVGNFIEWKKRNQSFEDLAAYFAFFDYGSYSLTGQGDPETLSGVGVTENLLPLLGARLALGRNFTHEESLEINPTAVIITDGLWRRRFGADPSIVGKAITLSSRSTTMVGVLAPEFDFRAVFVPGSKVDMLVPFPTTLETDRWGNTLAVIGRLKPGVAIATARSEFEVINEQIRKERLGWRFASHMTPLQQHLTGRFERGLLVLLAAVACVLLIACTNLSNLLLVRATSRRREIAIRAALGASRTRLLRQMITESMLVAFTGASVGLGLAYLGIRTLAALRDVNIPLLGTISLDANVLLFTVGAATFTGLMMGLVPALQSSSAAEQAEALKESARGTSEGRRAGWARGALVVTQVALACMLLCGAGLLIRSFLRVLEIDLGFRPERAGVWRIEAPKSLADGTARANFYDRLARRIETVPGVQAVGVTDALPLSRDRTWYLGVKGVQYERGQAPLAHPRLIDYRYPAAMGIRLVRGRYFNERDTRTSEPVVVINEKAARRLFPGGEEPVGRMVEFNGDRRVVGVVGNVRHQTVEEEGGSEAYLVLTQANSSSVELLVRTNLEVEAAVPGIRAALREIDPSIPSAQFQTLDLIVSRAVSPRRFLIVLLGAFAFAALLLASIGIYGVVSYSVGQRTQEIGIRMALGASASTVRRMVLERTLVLAAAGIAIGVTGALLLGQYISSLLFALEPRDPVTFGTTVAVLVLVALVAGYWPARRASRVDPMLALRGD